MGWSSGSSLFSSVIDTLKTHVSDADKRKQIYKELIPAFQEHDWDTQDECFGEDPAYDEALSERYPGWYTDD